MRKIKLHTGKLEDRRIDFDADSGIIIVDDSELTPDEIEDVARIAALAVSAMVPGMQITPDQAEMLVRLVVRIVEMAGAE